MSVTRELPATSEHLLAAAARGVAMLERWAVVFGQSARPVGTSLRPTDRRPSSARTAEASAPMLQRRTPVAGSRPPAGCRASSWSSTCSASGTAPWSSSTTPSCRIAGRRLPLDGIDYRTFARHVPEHVRYVDALAILAGRRKAHIDLKFMSPPALLAQPDATWRSRPREQPWTCSVPRTSS